MACLPSANVFSLTYRMVAIRPLIVAASSGSSRSTDGLKRIGASAALRGKIKGAFIGTSRLFQPPAFVRHVATKLHSTHVSTCPYVRVRTLWPRCFATKTNACTEGGGRSSLVDMQDHPENGAMR